MRDVWIERTRQAVFDEYISKWKDYYIPSVASSYGVPGEILKLNIIRENLLETWAYYYKLFRLCDDQEMTSTEIAEIMDLDVSMVSYVRNGKRAIRARKLYDKYKNYKEYVVIC